MRVKICRRSGASSVLVDDAMLVVIELPDGTPVSIAWQRDGSDGTYSVVTAHAAERDFGDLLRKLGISSESSCKVLKV